jgi:hypothetical protein
MQSLSGSACNGPAGRPCCTPRSGDLVRRQVTSNALDDRAYRCSVKFHDALPGKPTDNGLTESFSGRLRDQFLVHEFVTMHGLRKGLAIHSPRSASCSRCSASGR